MNNIGFTGSQYGMTKEQEEFLYSKLNKIPIATLHHGDCIGADAQACKIAVSCGHLLHCHPPSSNSKRAFVVSHVMENPKPYLDRNRDIVDASSILYATPNSFEEVLRSGTWATVRYARKQKKTIVIVYPDGSFVD